MKLISVLLFVLASPAKAGTYNCRITSQSDVNASTVSVRVLAENKNRRCLLFQNQGASVVYIKFGSAHTGTENHQLAAGARWEPLVIPANSVYIRSAAGVCTTTVLEGN